MIAADLFWTAIRHVAHDGSCSHATRNREAGEEPRPWSLGL